VTGTLRIDPKRLWVTVYKDDDEAADLWLNRIKVAPERFTRMDEKSNFWAMGDTGPCGPCSEIFYDHGPDIAGGPPGSKDEDGDRYVEIWNLVFMQFERSADGTMTPLPKPSVDTGMGLERTAAVMQGGHSNYDIDLFLNLIAAAAEVTGQKKKSKSPSLRVIADHIRACSFLIVDGVIPGNDGRGYVLRRIIRRAIRHGYQLGQHQPVLLQARPGACGRDGRGLPRAREGRRPCGARAETGRRALCGDARERHGAARGRDHEAEGKTIAGETVFKLYDTYGFPVDLTADIARERGLSIDQPGFEKEMEAQRERARAASKFGVDLRGPETLDAASAFSGYEQLVDEGRIERS
jgi:alanyl-tRNA synthetase